MLKFLKKLLIKVLLYITFIFFTLILKVYTIISNFIIKHKSNIKKFSSLIAGFTVSTKELCSQINLKKELEKCLINSK